MVSTLTTILAINSVFADNNDDVFTSCAAIEKLWSVAKSYYVKRLLQNFQVEGCIKKPKFLQFVMESFA